MRKTTLEDFAREMRGREKGIRRLAKSDIMGARREVDQLRREFVTALAGMAGMAETARRLDELDKFDMPPERPGTKARRVEEADCNDGGGWK